MATSTADDDLDGFFLDAYFSIEDVTMLVLVLLLLDWLDLENNEKGAQITVTKDLRTFIQLAVHGHMLECFHLIITHGVIGAIILKYHGASCLRLECLVSLSLPREALDGA